MAEWDETDLTPDEVRAMWEAATPLDRFRLTELTVIPFKWPHNGQRRRKLRVSMFI